MKTTIDAAGRLVIPRALREKAGLSSRVEVELSWHDGHIEIEPVELPVKLVRDGPLLVMVPEVDVAPLTPEMIEETRDALLRERVF